MSAIRTIAALALLLVAPLLAQAQPQGHAAFADFWAGFQNAVRARDAEKIAALTSFPLAVHGQTDSDRVRRLDKAQFMKALPTLLEQDSGMSRQPEPMASFVERTDAASALARSRGGGSVQVGSFRFEQRSGAWRLVRVYEER